RGGGGGDAEAERRVLTGGRTVDVEGGRVLEVARISIGGAVDDHDRRAGRDGDVPDPRRYPCHAEVALDRALEPERLLDERGDLCSVPAEQGLEVGALGDELERGAGQAHSGLLTPPPPLPYDPYALHAA